MKVSGVLLAVALLFGSMVSAAPASEAAAAISVLPASGPPTGTTVVTGSGFKASETVTIAFGGQTVGTVAASSTGAFHKSITVPSTATPGNHTVKATGNTSGRSATATFKVATAWPQFQFGANRDGLNPYENVLNPANVGSITKKWTVGIGTTNPGILYDSPVVANGVVYVGGADGYLYAIDVATHAVKWRGLVTQDTPVFTTPAVFGGTVFVTGDYGGLFAFPTNCANPCSYTWSGQTGSGAVNSGPAVSGGEVYVGSVTGTVSVFDASGCGGSTCAPLWTAKAGRFIEAPLSVSGGHVYVTDETPNSGGPTVYAFDANGVTHCSGTPKVCTPIWTAKTAGSINWSAPAVAGGTVYVADESYGLYAFAATDGHLRWKAPVGGTDSAPAVANGVVYLITRWLTALDANGCGATVCGALWTGTTEVTSATSPSVANGVVYTGTGVGSAIEAYDAAGCGAATCAPLWSNSASGRRTYSTPTVTDGKVYYAAPSTGLLYVYG